MRVHLFAFNKLQFSYKFTDKRICADFVLYDRRSYVTVRYSDTIKSIFKVNTP